MIRLIADSGSTTTDWALVALDNTVKMIKTAGINPVHQESATIHHTLTTELLPATIDSKIAQIDFYGAGCVGGTANERLASLLGELFPTAEINIESDLLGAARSLCGNTPGIAGILGTGANSCHYNGSKIVNNIPPLGYILGDEGSGASLGKAFLRRLLRGEIESSLSQQFYAEYDTNYADIIERVYRRPSANRYLASLSPFIAAHMVHPDIYTTVCETFKDYLCNHIMRYDYSRLPVHLTGSVAYYYQDTIYAIAETLGVKISSISRSPIDGLVSYHTCPNHI